MSPDEIFVLVLVIGSIVAVVAMAVHSRRAKTASNESVETVKAREE